MTTVLCLWRLYFTTIVEDVDDDDDDDGEDDDGNDDDDGLVVALLAWLLPLRMWSEAAPKHGSLLRENTAKMRRKKPKR